MLALKTMPKVCRFCLGKEPKQLMAAAEILNSSLTIEMVELFTGVQLNTASNIPCAICVDCKKLFTEWLEFRSICLSNDILFQQWHSTHTVGHSTETNEIQPQGDGLNLFKVEIMFPHEDIEDDYDINQTGSNVPASDNESDCIEEVLFEEILANDQQQVSSVQLTVNTDPSSGDETNSNCMQADPNVVHAVPKDSPPIPTKTEQIQTERQEQLCVICGILVNNLWYHNRAHASDPPTYACPHCPVKMKNQSNLARHIQAVHMKKVIKSCEPCGRGFSHINSYKAHMRSRHGIGETYRCQICSKIFKQPSGYKKHISQAHNDERNFICSVCYKPFKDRQALNVHKNVHSTERRYLCSRCPKKFKGASAKRAHELTHAGYIFKCTRCNKAYQYRSLLKMHVKKNHPEGDETSCKDYSHNLIGKFNTASCYSFCPPCCNVNERELSTFLICVNINIPSSRSSNIFRTGGQNQWSELTLASTAMDNVNYQTLGICRLCLFEDDHSLVNVSDIIDSSLTIDTIEQFTGIRITVTGNYPCAVCLNCNDTLQKSVAFRDFCLSNDMEYKQLLRSKIECTAENDINIEHGECTAENDINIECMIADPEETICVEIIDQYQEITGEQTEVSSLEATMVIESEPQCAPKPKPKTKPSKRQKQLCNICGTTVTYLKRHLNSHTKNTTYTCPYCSMRVTESSNLKRHIEIVHLRKEIVFCKICNKGFTTKNSHESHMRSHHGIGKEYNCKLCDKTYKNPKGYKVHMAKVHTYTSEMRFACPICSKRFFDRLTLKRHGRVHATERPYECGICSKQFKSSFAKSIHEIAHSGPDFECTICEKKYRYKSQLAQHVKKLHPEETD